ncbi:UNVERIFIED_CONTAM: protein EARLY FLOWERING 5 [Sesamum angustifolium]|uniref:Protein EARLY FLOWERING 5 n=1 Tax=Sesamum angustifolium TaxID=2727405 RepID=A0AAW2LHC8_9LAMI
MVKTTKGGKTMNPTDAYRKELRKKELKRNKKERKKVREVGILKKDPETLREQIQKLESNDLIAFLFCTVTWDLFEGGLLQKRKKESSIPDLKIPLPETSASNVASSSKSETEDSNLSVPPLPPPPPPLPSAISDSGDGSMLPTLPLPPPPPMPPKPVTTDITSSLPPPPLPPPPPPPGPPPKELLAARPPLPPPPPIHQSAQPPPPGTVGSENASKSDDSSSSNSIQMPTVLPPPPPPVGLPPKLGDNQPEGSSSESDMKGHFDAKEMLKMAPPPPPLRQQPPVPGAAMGPNLQPDLLPPGISRFPPPPPPTDMHPSLSAPGIAGQPVPPGVMVPLLPRPPFGPPPGPPPMMRPPLPPGPPPIPQDDLIARPSAPQKPSYVKSAASTVVKRPLAQHTPELTAMVPASVRVRRESALPKPKPKTPSTVLPSNRPIVAPPITRHESTGLSSAPKPQSIDDSYTAFLEDMKALGALDS